MGSSSKPRQRNYGSTAVLKITSGFHRLSGVDGAHLQAMRPAACINQMHCRLGIGRASTQ
eukprot:496169-Pyramimonas_sp.AAC.1